MDTSSNVVLMIPVSSAWDVSAVTQDISGWLTRRGFCLGRAERNSVGVTLTLGNPETTDKIELIITTTECAGHIARNRVLDAVLERRDEIDGVLSRLVERLEQLRLLTTPMAFDALDEDILVRRLADLGYL